MKEKRQVVIFDDDDGMRGEWLEKLEEVSGFAEGFTTRRVETREFGDGIEVLRHRQREARKDANERESSYSGTFFDETSILFVDYDLFDLPGDAGETGEEVAYLARCFSGCGVIVAVNQYRKQAFTFDLNLQGHPQSFADLNLLHEQIFNPGLWSTPWEGFRPWYWPHLPRAVEDFEQRISDVKENLDEGILDFLEIPPDVQEIFPLAALNFISPKSGSAATFREFVESSENTLRPKDAAVSREAFARIAAARLSKCLERLVLPGQNILVDAAHLLERYPSLFRADIPERLIGWPSVHELIDPDEGAMDIASIESCRLSRKAWLSRAVWYWPQVSGLEAIEEVRDPWSQRPRLAFCEDISRFLFPENATEFVAKVDSPFVRRFVSCQSAGYGPKLQFAL